MPSDASPEACDSYEHNLGHRPIQMDVVDLLRMVRGGAWSPGPVDLLVADPPCTPWSRGGKRQGQADERDMLAETVAIIEALRPRCWVIANVPGLDDADHWEHVVRPVIGGMAQRSGYVVDFAVFDAADFGVPQHRVRPFWFGRPAESRPILWPAPTHGDWSTMRLDGRKPWVTCRDALSRLPIEELGRPVRLRWKDGTNGPNHRPSKPLAPSATITRNSHGDGSLLLVNDRHPLNIADKPSYTVTTKGNRGAQGAYAMLVPGSKAPPQGMRIGDPDTPGDTVTAQPSRVGAGSGQTLSWPWDAPVTMIQRDPRVAPPGHHYGSNMSGPNAIVLSERAAAVLQGFPDGWLFSGATKKARWSQIGQAMPPPLAHAFATSVAAWCLRNK